MGKSKKTRTTGPSSSSATGTPSSPTEQQQEPLATSVSTEIQRQRDNSYIRNQSRNILQLTRPSDRSLSTDGRTASAVTIDSAAYTESIGTDQRSSSAAANEKQGKIPDTRTKQHGKRDMRQQSKSDDVGAEAPPRLSRRITSHPHGDAATNHGDSPARTEIESTVSPQYPGAERIAPNGRLDSYSSLLPESSRRPTDVEEGSSSAVMATAVSREDLEQEVRRKLMAEAVTAEAVVEILPTPTVSGTHKDVVNGRQMESGALQEVGEETIEKSSQVKSYRRKIRLLVALLVTVAIIAVVATVVAVTRSSGDAQQSPPGGPNQNESDDTGGDGPNPPKREDNNRRRGNRSLRLFPEVPGE